MSDAAKCRHGSIDLGKDKAKYQGGLRTILKLVGRYTAKKSRSVGRKSADKFMIDCPDLVNEEMIALLVRTGSSMILANGPGSKFIIQSIAEVTGCLERKVWGHSTAKKDLRLKVDSDGYMRTRTRNLRRFYRKRIPCSCLDKKSNKKKEEKKACCSFDQCSERKALKRLQVCSGCMDAIYCCIECQSNDWESHSMVCRFVADKKSDPVRNSTKEEHTEVTENDSWSETELEHWKIEEADSKRLRNSNVMALV